jgi:glycosyltransferase involved in cell wall biosynthesis
MLSLLQSVEGALEAERQSVLLVTTAHQPRDIRIFQKEARLLSASGFRVALATTVAERSTEDGVDFIPLGPGGGSRWLRIGRNLRALSVMLRDSQSVIHFHDPELLLTTVIPLILQRKLVYDVHEFYYDRIRESTWLPRFTRHLLATAYSKLERILLPHYAGVVVVTPLMRDRYTAFMPESRVALVCNYPNLSEENIAEAFRSPRPIPGPYVIHTGGVSYTKAFHVLVSVAELLAERHPEVTIVNFGPVDLSGYSGAQQRELLRRARSVNVQLRNSVSQNELLPWIAHSKIGYAPRATSTNERYGQFTKVFEYFAFGKPVVASAVGLTDEIIKNAGAGFSVEPMNPEAHAAAISELIVDRTLYERMSAASQWVGSQYSFEAEFACLLRLYRSIYGTGV